MAIEAKTAALIPYFSCAFKNTCPLFLRTPSFLLSCLFNCSAVPLYFSVNFLLAPLPDFSYFFALLPIFSSSSFVPIFSCDVINCGTVKLNLKLLK